jgi:hypothetical protein
MGKTKVHFLYQVTMLEGFKFKNLENCIWNERREYNIQFMTE